MTRRRAFPRYRSLSARSEEALCHLTDDIPRTSTVGHGPGAEVVAPSSPPFVDEERVAPQEGDFYGGWITSDIVGPFKGGPGTRLW